MAPGFGGNEQRQDGAAEEFRLTVETVNSTGWQSLRKRLTTTTAHVVMAQETWVTQAQVPAASSWARRNGWRSIWTPAKVTDKNGVASGVALFARDFMGLHYVPGRSHVVHPARAVMGRLEAPGQRAMRILSCHLRHGVDGHGINAEVLADVRSAVQDCGEDEVCIIGGDFNMDPQQLIGTEIDRDLEMTVLHTDPARGTFRTKKACSTIDYFLITDRLAAAVEEIATVEASGIRCHTPVQLRFRPRLASLQALHLRMPPKIPVDRVYGPVPPPPRWEDQERMADAALAAARAKAGNADDLMQSAYAAWANAAEEELEAVTGIVLPKKGVRAKCPRLVWRSVLPEKRVASGFSRPSAAVWLKGVVAELQRIVGAALAEEPPRGHAPDGGDDGMAVDDGPAAPLADHGQGHDERADDQGQGRRYRPPVTRAACYEALMLIRESLAHDAPAGVPDDDLRELMAKVMTTVDDMIDVAAAGEGACSGTDATTWDTQRRGAVMRIGVTVDSLRETLDDVDAKAAEDEKARERGEWKAWLTEDFAAGASRAHAFSRLPQEAVPAAAEVPGAAMSSTPEALLDEQRRKYAGLWRPANGPYEYAWGEADELPSLTPKQLREASRTFKRKTACTFDGFHPRHFAEMSDGALRTLATILQAVEVTGRWPRQLRLVMTALIPKPKGGFRPVGILPAPYRLWAKARRGWADRWEQDNARPYLSSAKGNGPLDTMWRLGARQEAGTVGEDQAVVIAEDLGSFFETVDRERLMGEAAAMGYPAPILRAALGAYSSARMVTLQGRVSREIFPTVGVIAGCSLAMSLTKLLYVRALDEYVAKLPGTVSLDVHVDDFTLAAIGPPHRAMADALEARAKLGEVMRGIGCHFAEGKTAVTATTRRLAAEVARRLGVPGAVTSTACILGVDCTAAARRGRIRAGAKKAQRLRAALARRGRLLRLRQTLGTRACHVFRTGVLPSATYDAAVWGMTDVEVVKLRRLAGVTMSPRARGRSLAATHLWFGVPTAEAEVAPVLMYARAVWKAITQREEAEMRGCSIANIRAMWDAAKDGFDPLVQEAEEARKEDGMLPPEVARRIWGRAKGPMAAAALSLSRVGWRFKSAFVLAGPDGTEHVLTTASPTMTRDLLKDAMRRMMERRVAVRMAGAHAEFTGRRACMDLAIAAARPGKRVSRHQAAVFRAVACNAVWTATRARELGYDTDGLCTLCKAAPDTIRHRTYDCPCTREAVMSAVPRWFWDEATRSGAREAFWTTAIMPHPGDVAPPPREDAYCEVEYHDDQLEKGTNSQERIGLVGKVYVDGSARPSPIRGLARAAGSLVMTDVNGEPRKTIQAVVPRHLPQTSQAAEHYVMALAYEGARGAVEAIGDCYNVVRGFAAAPAKALSPARKYAGIILSSFRDPVRRRMVELRWTKAHRAATGAEDPGEIADIKGNDAADRAAKQALALHPPLGQELQATVDFYAARAPHVVAAVTTAMAAFPRMQTDMGRIPRSADGRVTHRGARHQWHFAAGTWRCRACDAYITAKSIPPYRERQRCTGKGMTAMAADYARAGHRIVRADSQLPIVLCTRCGAWGNKRVRKLGRPCEAPTSAGVQAIRRAMAGWHPLTSKNGGDGALRRDRIRVTAAYDSITGSWCPFEAEPQGEGGNDATPEVVARPEAATGAVDEGECGDVQWPVLAHEDPPHGPSQGVEEEEDVFGHGGSLDQDINMDLEPQDQGASAAGRGCGGDGSAVGPAEPHRNLRNVDCDAVGVRPSRRRPRDQSEDNAPRNFVREAVERLGRGLARRDADARGRMDRLLGRVRARAAAARPQSMEEGGEMEEMETSTIDARPPRKRRGEEQEGHQRRLRPRLGGDHGPRGPDHRHGSHRPDGPRPARGCDELRPLQCGGTSSGPPGHPCSPSRSGSAPVDDADSLTLRSGEGVSDGVALGIGGASAPEPTRRNGLRRPAAARADTRSRSPSATRRRLCRGAGPAADRPPGEGAEDGDVAPPATRAELLARLRGEDIIGGRDLRRRGADVRHGCGGHDHPQDGPGADGAELRGDTRGDGQPGADAGGSRVYNAAAGRASAASDVCDGRVLPTPAIEFGAAVDYEVPTAVHGGTAGVARRGTAAQAEGIGVRAAASGDGGSPRGYVMRTGLRRRVTGKQPSRGVCPPSAADAWRPSPGRPPEGDG